MCLRISHRGAFLKFKDYYIGAKEFFLEKTNGGYFLLGFYNDKYYYNIRFMKGQNLIKVLRDNKNQEINLVLKLNFEGAKCDVIKRKTVLGFHISPLDHFNYEREFNFDANFDVIKNWYHCGKRGKINIKAPVLFKANDIQALGENAVVVREFYIPTGSLFRQIAEMFKGKKSDYKELFEILKKIKRRKIK